MKCYSKFGLAIVFMVQVSIMLASNTVHAAGPWYVAPSGDDSNDCMSAVSPCATINGAIMKASASDTVLVAIGTYSGIGAEVVLLDKDATLSGGWNSAFTTQGGMSTIDGQGERRGIFVNSGVTATTMGFVVENGAGPTEGGGGIFNAGAILTLVDSIVRGCSSHGGTQGGGILTRSGTLALNNSTVTNNTANEGAGIYSDGGATVVLNNSTVSNNSSSGYGGGIYTLASVLQLTNSTVSGNSASIRGGGIVSSPPALVTVTNTTISGNTAGWDGGGIYHTGNNSTVIMNNSTVANNQASDGGGIFTGGGVNSLVTLRNTIVAGNSASSNPDCRAPFVTPTGSAGYNLIGDTSGCVFTAVLGDLTDIDPLLGPLQDNGGATPTHGLLPASPAIDAGNPTGCADDEGNLLTSDQRGFTRPQGPACDIGAFEASALVRYPTLTMGPFYPTTSGSTWTYQADGTGFTRTVLAGTVTVNGVVTKVFEDNTGFRQYLTNDSLGIRLHRQFVPNTDIGLGFPVDLQVTFTPPVLIASATMDVGDTVTSSGTARTNKLPRVGVLTLPYTASFSSRGFYPVTLPAGSFQALKLEGSVDVSGDVVSETLYLVRNVGAIKLVDSSLGIMQTAELVSTNLKLPSAVTADFDRDMKADIGVYDVASGNWFWVGSTSGFDYHVAFGGANYVPVPADYDGDREVDTAVYDTTTGNWFIAQSTAGFKAHPAFGGVGYIPVPGDYDGDGKTDIAVYQPSTGNWFWVGSTSGFKYHLGFGGVNYVPVPGDYDGDGKTDTAVYDKTNGNWFIAQTTVGFKAYPTFGGAGLIPLPGDYDGDAKTDIGIYETSSGNWSWVGSTSGFGERQGFGGAGYIPVPADYDGDGFTDTAVYDATSGNWLIDQTWGGYTVHPAFGGTGYVPVLPQVTILRALGLL